MTDAQLTTLHDLRDRYAHVEYAHSSDRSDALLYVDCYDWEWPAIKLTRVHTAVIAANGDES